MDDEMSVEAISHHLYAGGDSRRDPQKDVAFLLNEINSLRRAANVLKWIANRRDSLPQQYREVLAPWVTLLK